MTILNKSLEMSRSSPDGFGCLGVLFVGHGTRSASGQDEFRQLHRQFADLISPIASQMAFLEHAQPDIPQAIAQLVACGVDRLLVVPALLFSAGHARTDIPRIVQQAAAQNSILVIGQTAPLEFESEIVQLSAQRFNSAVGQADLARATWILVGRGSSHPEIGPKLREFVRLRQELTPVRQAMAAFIVGHYPSVKEAMDEASLSGGETIVVQPHLLFSGVLLDQLGRQVHARQKQNAHQQWILADRLGADRQIAELLAARAIQRLETDTRCRTTLHVAISRRR